MAVVAGVLGGNFQLSGISQRDLRNDEEFRQEILVFGQGLVRGIGGRPSDSQHGIERFADGADLAEWFEGLVDGGA